MGSDLVRGIETDPVILIDADRGWLPFDRAALWEYRDLLVILAQRDLRVRYKQTALGAGWAVVQPLFAMITLTLVFHQFAKIPSGEAPYSIFVLAGLLFWNVFSQTLARVGTSLVANANLIGKIYFPRLIVPASSAMTPLSDFGIATVLLVGLMVWYGIAPSWKVIVLPALALATIFIAFAFGIWLCVLNVRYRDVGHLIPILLQFWMYLSPVGYPSSLVPERFRWLYYLNPLAWLIDGSRWALIGGAAPPLWPSVASGLGVLALLAGGIAYFGHAEDTLVDEI